MAAAAISIWFWAAILRVVKHVVPLPRLVGLMHRTGRGQRSTDFESRLERYLLSTSRFPWRAPANCLERSLGTYRVLCRRSAAPELVIGFSRNEPALRGHVWVRVDGRVFGDSSAIDRYTETAVFDAEGNRRIAEGVAERLTARAVD